MNSLDLGDCASPEDAIAVLRNAAQRFYEDTSELQSAWQDKHAGRFWTLLARELERVANKAEGWV